MVASIFLPSLSTSTDHLSHILHVLSLSLLCSITGCISSLSLFLHTHDPSSSTLSVITSQYEHHRVLMVLIRSCDLQSQLSVLLISSFTFLHTEPGNHLQTFRQNIVSAVQQVQPGMDQPLKPHQEMHPHPCLNPLLCVSLLSPASALNLYWDWSFHWAQWVEIMEARGIRSLIRCFIFFSL